MEATLTKSTFAELLEGARFFDENLLNHEVQKASPRYARVVDPTDEMLRKLGGLNLIVYPAAYEVWVIAA
jgi:hypothetical protein